VRALQPCAGPSVDDILNLKRVGAPAISPNGHQAALPDSAKTNWSGETPYETEKIWRSAMPANTGQYAAGHQRARGHSPRQTSRSFFAGRSGVDFGHTRRR
jgi:hypothetical protein